MPIEDTLLKNFMQECRYCFCSACRTPITKETSTIWKILVSVLLHIILLVSFFMFNIGRWRGKNKTKINLPVNWNVKKIQSYKSSQNSVQWVQDD